MNVRGERSEPRTFIDNGYERSIWLRPRVYNYMFSIREVHCEFILILSIQHKKPTT